MNTLELKTLNELSQYSFFVPSYQRGYRWTAQEVVDLLNDIDEFRPRETATDEKTWYCLQPIVVKAINDNLYEVIDGQQRLTTIYLVLHYLNQEYVAKSQDKLFSLDFQTRKEATAFLSNPEADNYDSNIDFFHIHNAYVAIDEWFSQKDSNFDKGAFRSKLKFNTKVIWYESVENEPISVFTRLNIGKISLSNSELIKALFLNSSNFKDSETNKLRLRQLEIANEWDLIEAALQNNRLWFFITNEKRTDNRIEFIFNLISGSGISDAYSTFRFFSEKLKNPSADVIKINWEMIQAHFQRFNEWFNDRILYHKVGFILNSEIENMQKLYKTSSDSKKSAFVEYLDEIIKTYYRKINLMELDYESKQTRSVLLLYNILTMLQNAHDFAYFPFDAFKNMKWNVEHIASVKDAPPDDNHRMEWLNDVMPYIDDVDVGAAELKARIENCNVSKEESFVPLYEAIVNYFNQKVDEADFNGISNLALLDERTNKGYKNAVFPLKRKKIIELDKTGSFVPLCTKNVFLKYFSDYPPKISFWTQSDREKYQEDLARVLRGYMEVQA